jgi:hypothetical protein
MRSTNGLMMGLMVMGPSTSRLRCPLVDAARSRLRCGLGDQLVHVGDVDPTTATTIGRRQHVQRIEPGVPEPARATLGGRDVDPRGRVPSSSTTTARHQPLLEADRPVTRGPRPARLPAPPPPPSAPVPPCTGRTIAAIATGATEARGARVTPEAAALRASSRAAGPPLERRPSIRRCGPLVTGCKNAPTPMRPRVAPGTFGPPPTSIPATPSKSGNRFRSSAEPLFRCLAISLLLLGVPRAGAALVLRAVLA